MSAVVRAAPDPLQPTDALSGLTTGGSVDSLCDMRARWRPPRTWASHGRMKPPRDEAELQVRLRRVAGRSLQEIADGQGVAVPRDLRRHKGWVGQLLERALGASAGS